MPSNMKGSIVPTSVPGINHAKRAYLRDMKVFVLDNSLRESTVAQPKGHTLDDKSKILEQIKAVGFTDVIVAAFGGKDDRRVDDAFCEKLDTYFSDSSLSISTYAFSEIWDTFLDDRDILYGENYIPVGLQRMKKYGIQNAIIEIDVNASYVDWGGKVTIAKAIDVLTFLLKWINSNLPSNNAVGRRNFVNLRDMPLAMIAHHSRVLELVKGIAHLPKTIRPAGIIFEEPLGEYFPDEVANWTSMMRQVMDENDWESKWQTEENQKAEGLLLYHTHEQYGFANATVLDVLAAGADGMWCGLSEEGASLNHASSCVALTNLARLGNKDVKDRFNTNKLVSAAKIVAEVTTGNPVPFKQVVYGGGALDECFGFGAIAQGKRTDSDYNGDGEINSLDKFSVAGLIGVKDPPVRISTLAAPSLIAKRLQQCFGNDAQFTNENGQKLLIEIKQRLINNIKEDYNEPCQLAKLWVDTFGKDNAPTSMMQLI